MHALHHGLELLLHAATLASTQTDSQTASQTAVQAAAQLAQVVQTSPHVFPDTVITKQVIADAGFWGTVAVIVRTLFSIALLTLAAGFSIALWNLRKIYVKVDTLLDRLHTEVTPLLRNATLVSDDAREIVTSVKGDARLVQQTVAAANTRLIKAVRQTEERIDRFNALLEVVQEEAESTFISTAATVRGVRTGFGQIFTSEGEDDDDIGDERSHETGTPYAGPARPRVRPK